MTFADIYSQSSAITVLTRAIERDRVASSYLFEGPRGVGKTLTAVALGQALNCTEQPGRGCGKCAVCERIVAGNHPDVRVFAPRDEGAGNIQVEFVREELLPFTRYAPFEGRTAVAIFPSADVSFPATHPEAANAILKTLEEPRANMVFVLASERPDRLLPTIRSRCQRVAFKPLPHEKIDAILAARGVELGARQAVIPLAAGSADVAIELAERDTAHSLLERAFDIDEVLRSGGPGSVVSLAEELAKNEDLPLILHTLSVLYRDVARAALFTDSALLHFPAETKRIAARAQELGAQTAALRSDRIRQLGDLFDRNANVELALDSLLFELHDPRPAHPPHPPRPVTVAVAQGNRARR